MEERICTKAQKEASWKQKGLLRLPKSHRQGMLALASKEFVEGLRCYSEVRRMLAMGKRPRDVAIHIQRNHECPILTFNTLKKYAQTYRVFFIPPYGRESSTKPLGLQDLESFESMTFATPTHRSSSKTAKASPT